MGPRVDESTPVLRWSSRSPEIEYDPKEGWTQGPSGRGGETVVPTHPKHGPSVPTIGLNWLGRWARISTFLPPWVHL